MGRKIAFAVLIGLAYSPHCLPQSGFPVVTNTGKAGNTETMDNLDEQAAFARRLPGLVPYHERYAFKNFKDGLLYSSTHKKTDTLRLNYDRYFRGMSMIDERGDTVFVPDFELIKYALLEDGELYYHDFRKGYYHFLTDPNNTIRLVVQHRLKIINTSLMRDHEVPEPVSMKSYFSVVYQPENPKYYRQYVFLSRETSYFLFDQQETLYAATRVNFFKLFKNHTQGISGYLEQLARQHTPIRFSREEDLKALLKFCLSLEQ